MIGPLIDGAIKRRKVSSVEVTKALMARIDKWQPTLNAFARVEAEDALKSAKAADRALAAGKAKGPLHGVPLAHKDMYYSKGKLAECGSKIRKGWIAPATATAVERLEAAGSFRLGAVNMVRRSADGRLHGDMVDGLGFMAALAKHAIDVRRHIGGAVIARTHVMETAGVHSGRGDADDAAGQGGPRNEGD